MNVFYVLPFRGYPEHGSWRHADIDTHSWTGSVQTSLMTWWTAILEGMSKLFMHVPIQQHWYPLSGKAPVLCHSCSETYSMCVFYLEYGHLVPQLALLLGGKAELVDDFDSHVPPCLPVLSWWRDGALATDVDVNWTSRGRHGLSYFIQPMLQSKRISSLFFLLLVKTCCLHYPQCNYSADN